MTSEFVANIVFKFQVQPEPNLGSFGVLIDERLINTVTGERLGTPFTAVQQQKEPPLHV